MSKARPAPFAIAVVSLLTGLGSGGGALSARTPNISGVWNRYPPYPDTFSNQPDPPELRLVEPPLKPLYMQQWQAMRDRREQADAQGKPLPTPSSECRPEGMPGIMGAHYALQILQDPGLNQVTVLGEFMMQTRRIYLGETMPAADTIDPSYFGYSAGKWTGDVLEVVTQGVREDVLYEDIPHSKAMKITERIHLASADILHDDITIVDPDYLARPYSFTLMYKREAPSYKVGEYVCDNQHNVIEKDGSLDMKVEPANDPAPAKGR